MLITTESMLCCCFYAWKLSPRFKVMFLILVWLNLSLHQISACSLFHKSHEQGLIIAVQTRAEPVDRQNLLSRSDELCWMHPNYQSVVFSLPLSDLLPGDIHAWWHCILSMQIEISSGELIGFQFILFFFFFFFTLLKVSHGSSFFPC